MSEPSNESSPPPQSAPAGLQNTSPTPPKQAFNFIVRLYNLEIEEDLDRGDQIYPDVFITNNQACIRRLLTPRLRPEIGELEFQQISGNGPVIYTQGESERISDPQQAQALLCSYLNLVHNFLNVLWIVKDHAVNFELGFMEVGPSSRHGGVLSNLFAASNNLADGSLRTTKFTRDEIREARAILREEFGLACTPENFEANNRRLNRGKPWLQTVSRKDLPRGARFFNFLAHGRSANDLGIKMALYCSSLEVLFSTDASEMTHKIAERVAAFLAESAPERLSTFHAIKKAYSIRSKVLHGDVIYEKLLAELPAACVELDQLLRRVALKQLSHEAVAVIFEAKKEFLEEYLLSLTLTGPQPDLAANLADQMLTKAYADGTILQRVIPRGGS